MILSFFFSFLDRMSVILIPIPPVFSQCLTLYFHPFPNRCRASERGLGSPDSLTWLLLLRLNPPAILSAPVECLSVSSLLYPCMNGCKVNQLLGKPEPLLIKPQNSPVLKHSAPRFVHGPPQTPWLLSYCRLFPLWAEGNEQKVRVAGVLTRSGLLPR